MTKAAPGDGRASQLLSRDERRRSQRVVIRIPVTLQCTVDERQLTFDANTLSVNDHGAMLISSRTLAADTVLEMENVRTRQKLNCRVARKPMTCAEGYLIPVEFLTPASDFWGITFPPANWKPSED